MKLNIDCSNGKLANESLNNEEQMIIEKIKIMNELRILEPSIEEIEKAERQLESIELLFELGVI